MNLLKQIQLMQRLMKDENFRVFMAHPKVQAAFKDPDFQKAMQTQDASQILSNPKLLALKDDPELAGLMLKLQTSLPGLLS